MRVLVLSSVFPTPARPTHGVFVRERVKHVADHCEVVVVAPIYWFPLNRVFRGRQRASAPAVERHGAITVHHPRVLCVPGVAKCLDGILYVLSVLPMLVRLRRRFPFDLIDAHFTYPDGLAGVLLGRIFRCPVMVTVRGSHDLRHSTYRLRRPQIRYAVRAAAGVLSVSASLRDLALGLGAAPDRVRVIPNGVDATRFRPGNRAAARAALDLPADRRISLTVASLVEGKGHHLLLEVLPRLVARRPELLHVIVGDDPLGGGYARRLERLVEHHALQRHVRFAAQRPHDEIPQWLAAADLFCLATRVEGRSNAILEALACGLPVVSTRVGGNGEIIRDGTDGFLVPYWDAEAFGHAVLAALERRWDHALIAERAQRRSWYVTAGCVVDEFRRALADTPSRHGGVPLVTAR